jgi:mannitol-1-phosphate 5-dehydrogenase
MAKKVFVQWGAGNIGRTLMGQLFARMGFHLIFIDSNKTLVTALNQSHSYTIESIGREKNETYVVKHLCAIEVTEQGAIDKALIETDYLSISVGKDSLKSIVKPLSCSIMKRWVVAPERPLDIIIGENIIDGSLYLQSLLKNYLPHNFPLTTYIGFVETSIGKMVPLQDDPSLLRLRCEPYKELYLDERGFLNSIPTSPWIHPVTPIRAYVERNLYIHKLGHAAAAYIGCYLCPQEPYIDQVLTHISVFNKVRSVMQQSMNIILSKYPKIFSEKELTHYIDDLLLRFTNPLLKDTVYRVGKDLKRKLHFTDRIMGAIITAHSLGLSWSTIGEVFVHALHFCPTADFSTETESEDEKFLKIVRALPFKEQVSYASSLDSATISEDSKKTILNALEILNDKLN